VRKGRRLEGEIEESLKERVRKGKTAMENQDPSSLSLLIPLSSQFSLSSAFLTISLHFSQFLFSLPFLIHSPLPFLTPSLLTIHPPFQSQFHPPLNHAQAPPDHHLRPFLLPKNHPLQKSLFLFKHS